MSDKFSIISANKIERNVFDIQNSDHKIANQRTQFHSYIYALSFVQHDCLTTNEELLMNKSKLVKNCNTRLVGDGEHVEVAGRGAKQFVDG